MNLENLTTSSAQLDSVIQRRPSLSSLSSTSGYDSSTFNPTSTSGPMMVANSHMANIRASPCPTRTYTGLSEDHPGSGLMGENGPPLSADVGPWVEQQKQQQSLNVELLEAGKREHVRKLGDRVTNRRFHATNHANSSANDSTLGSENEDFDDDERESRGDGDHDDDLIPTAIVIKNIPFAIKKEQLLDVMTKHDLPLPYAFNYHFDNGVFRGLAFANFASSDETSMVVNQLNGREIGGRKLRVEYKKMLPLQERERIEREKREKRGQLEEQHRSTSNASLASLVSVTSTTAATKNLSVNGQTYPSQTERVLAQFPSASNNIPIPPPELNFSDPEVLELYSQLLTYRDDASKLIYELAFPATLHMSQRKTLSLVCSFLNLMELFDNGLIIIRRKTGQQSIQQRQQQLATYNAHVLPQQSASAHAGAAQQMIPSQMTPAMQTTGTHNQGNLSNGLSSHSSSMMNLSQMPTLVYPNNLVGGNANQPELMRSQSQSALPLARARQSSSTPVQSQPAHQNHQGQYAHYQQSGSQPSKGASQNKYQNYGALGANAANPSTHQQGQMSTPTSSSAAALLRSSNNRSFVDVRSSPSIGATYQGSSAAGSPTPQQHAGLYSQPGHFFMGGQGSHVNSPTTPLQSEVATRFSPFGQHGHMSGSISSLQGNATNSEEYGLNDGMNSKFNSMSLNAGYEQQKGSGIWGPRK